MANNKLIKNIGIKKGNKNNNKERKQKRKMIEKNIHKTNNPSQIWKMEEHAQNKQTSHILKRGLLNPHNSQTHTRSTNNKQQTKRPAKFKKKKSKIKIEIEPLTKSTFSFLISSRLMPLSPPIFENQEGGMDERPAPETCLSRHRRKRRERRDEVYNIRRPGGV